MFNAELRPDKHENSLHNSTYEDLGYILWVFGPVVLSITAK